MYRLRVSDKVLGDADRDAARKHDAKTVRSMTELGAHPYAAIVLPGYGTELQGLASRVRRAVHADLAAATGLYDVRVDVVVDDVVDA